MVDVLAEMTRRGSWGVCGGGPCCHPGSTLCSGSLCRRKVGQCEDLATQSEVLGAPASASPGSLLEMQSLHPRPTELECAFELGPQVSLMHLKMQEPFV